MGKYKVGIDVGSTTIKVLVIDENNNIKYIALIKDIFQI